MNPEQAVANAADVLDEARKVHFDPERSGALVVVAEGWTRLYEALVHTATLAEPPAELAPNPDDTAGVYRERAALVAHLAAVYPSILVFGADPEAPDWPVIYVTTPHGQMSWHLADSDLDLFEHVLVVHRSEAPAWDGHTTAEKYERLAACTRDTYLDNKIAT